MGEVGLPVMLGAQWIMTWRWKIPLAIFLFVVWIQRVSARESYHNYHQQPRCLARHWREVESGFLQWPVCVETRWQQQQKPSGDPVATTSSPSSSSSSPVLKFTTTVDTTTPVVGSVENASRETGATDQGLDIDPDADSLLDNAKFLSFEDWKKQNLAKAGQSAENVGGNRRAATAGKDHRRRPTGINNALESLGDDGEIELDFVGFGGADPSEAAKSTTSWDSKVLPGGGDLHGREEAGRGGEGEEGAGSGRAATTDPGRYVGGGSVDAPTRGVSGSRSKDAGTTCKERFNYASFDCAATVLKTNPEGKGSSSVLVENKDSYMLNECRAQNKFLILELCDDILVDTVVLANYEFFSSIFHTFRVSVADRYPAKPDQWKELGIYEARNTREVQAFAVDNPLIWARYLRIEFLTHYGNEFFCPLSLVRVHGTTMLEEYKHDGEAGRLEEDIQDEPTPVVAETAPAKHSSAQVANPTARSPDLFLSETCSDSKAIIEQILLGHMESSICGAQDTPSDATSRGGEIVSVPGQPSPTVSGSSSGEHPGFVGGGDAHAEAKDPKATAVVGMNAHPSPASSVSTSASDTVANDATSETDTRASSPSKEEQGGGGDLTRSTVTQPPSANPTTQESFFKSVNKRLQMLETNSSLSLQYIEEQSRILRDAFAKVEKRQLTKTSTFLEHLNVKVLNELKQFRDQYDHVWKSVALEFEHQRIQYHQEIYSLSAQLGVVADELVFQKRVAVIQSIVVLFCFALVLFSRGAASGYIELPSMQNMVARSYSLRSSSPMFSSPPGSPGSTRAGSSYRSANGHRRELSDDSQNVPPSPTIAYSPPTPSSTSDESSSEAAAKGAEVPRATTPSSGDSELLADDLAPLHRSHSSPPVMNGGDEEGNESLASDSEDSLLSEHTNEPRS